MANKLSGFDDFLLQAGCELFQSYRADNERIKGKQVIEGHIKQAAQYLQETEPYSLEHTLALIVLCHAYKARGMYDWNRESLIDLATLRQSIECFSILSQNASLSEMTIAYIAEQRLWLCERYKLISSQQKTKRPDMLSVKILDQLIDQDFVKVVAAKSQIEKSEKTKDVLFNALCERRLGTKTKTDAAPFSEWWRDDVEDRALFLLRKIRTGADIYSTEIWQWQFETMLRSIADQSGGLNHQLVIDRIASKQNILSAHKGRKFKRPDMDAKVFWIRCWRTQCHKGFRVYSAAIAREPRLVEAIIKAQMSDDRKRWALMQLGHLTIGSKASMKTYKEYLELRLEPKIYQDIISGCMQN